MYKKLICIQMKCISFMMHKKMRILIEMKLYPLNLIKQFSY